MVRSTVMASPLTRGLDEYVRHKMRVGWTMKYTHIHIYNIYHCVKIVGWRDRQTHDCMLIENQ